MTAATVKSNISSGSQTKNAAKVNFAAFLLGVSPGNSGLGLALGGCLGRGGGGGRLRLLRLAGALALGLLVAGVVSLDELDQRHFGGVAEALRTELVDAGVAAGAVRELLVRLVEEKGHGVLVADVAQDQAAQVHGVLLVGLHRGILGLRDRLLDERAQ